MKPSLEPGSSSSRRKSTINLRRHTRIDDNLGGGSSTLELEKLEQEITLVLQQIDTNLSRSNSIINDRLFPILRKYATLTSAAWNNVSFWKYFLEEAAEVEIQDYDEDPKAATERNTLANSKVANFNSSDDETSENEKALEPLKRPALKNIQAGEETGTWTAEQQKGLLKNQQSQYQIQASTPQLASRPSLIADHDSNKNIMGPPATAIRFDSNDTFAPPPPVATSNSQPQQMFNTLMNNLSPIRRNQNSDPKQSHIVTLDNHRKVLISPKKSSTRTQIFDNADNKRTSMIQNFINSSPTLPEPPRLLSEIGRSSFGKSGGSSSNGENHENIPISSSDKQLNKLSPIQIGEVTPNPKKRTSNEELQRFPRTPIFSSGGKRTRISGANDLNVDVDVTRTPLGVRIRYGDDDSDLQPPDLQNKPSDLIDANQDPEDEDVPPLPELETIEIQNRKRRVEGSPTKNSNGERDKLPVDDDEENVFLEGNSQTQNQERNSTVYHSIIQQEEENPKRSYSNLFQDHNVNDKQDNAEDDENNNNNSRNFDNLLDNDTTDNSNSSLGPILRERWNSIKRLGS